MPAETNEDPNRQAESSFNVDLGDEEMVPMTAAVYQPRVTAGMPLPLLIDKARRHGAPLERRHLAALDGLALLLPHHSAAGYATPNQIGDAARYTGRWMRTALAECEELGLLEWRRGGVREGRATPGFFRVCKARLCEMITEGAVTYSQLVRVRSSTTRARIAGLRYVQRQKRRSGPVEVTDNLSPFGEVTGAAEGPPEPPASPARVKMWASVGRANLLQARA